jgi:beta-1,4-mannosyl-glycoprotein beta-1,4-N-acetylglucosaminyltransferase
MKMIDCVMFFNEVDLLEFRLKLLDSHVDKFVIAESNITHSGKPKSYHFEENSTRFGPWIHKIEYIQINQTTDGLDFDQDERSYNPESGAFKLENAHRNALSFVSSIADDDDLVLISDLDEIPNPRVFKKKWVEPGPVALSMLLHYYYLNCQSAGAERWWNGTVVCTGRQFKQTTPQQLRNNRDSYKSVENGGWHFSYLGGVEKIKNKIRSFAHTEFNREEYLDDAQIQKALEEGRDIYHRPGIFYKFVSVYYYPKFLRRVMQQYPDFLYKKMGTGFFTRLYYTIKRIFS